VKGPSTEATPPDPRHQARWPTPMRACSAPRPRRALHRDCTNLAPAPARRGSSHQLSRRRGKAGQPDRVAPVVMWHAPLACSVRKNVCGLWGKTFGPKLYARGPGHLPANMAAKAGKPRPHFRGRTRKFRPHFGFMDPKRLATWRFIAQSRAHFGICLAVGGNHRRHSFWARLKICTLGPGSQGRWFGGLYPLKQCLFLSSAVHSGRGPTLLGAMPDRP